MDYKKGDLTKFAKTCAWGAYQMMNGICIAGEIKGDLCRDILNGNEELLLEISKRFAKNAKDTSAFNVENGEVQNFQKLIEMIIECCDDNDWFGNEIN